MFLPLGSHRRSNPRGGIRFESSKVSFLSKSKKKLMGDLYVVKLDIFLPPWNLYEGDLCLWGEINLNTKV